MNKQSHWLFEVPPTLGATRSNFELGDSEWEVAGKLKTTRRAVPQSFQQPQRTRATAARRVKPTQQISSLSGRTLTYADVRSDRIDVFAQRALLRMSKNPAMSADAAEMADAVKSGKLGGIYKEDEKVPALRARKMNSSWWLIIPKGEDAVLFLDPEKPRTGTPIIVFRDSARSLPQRLDPALLKAWQTYKLWQRGKQTGEVQQCSQVLVNEVGMTEALVGNLLNNVIPHIFCQVSGGSTSCLPNFPIPTALSTPARDLSRAEARDIVIHLVKQGAFQLRSGVKFDTNCQILKPRSLDTVTIAPPIIDDVEFVNDDPKAKRGNPILHLDLRMGVMLFRLANMLRSRWGVREIHHIGLGGGNPSGDAHRSGRAIDLTGVVGDANKGIIGGVFPFTSPNNLFNLNVLRDWGKKSVVLNGKQEKIWPQNKSFRDTLYRLDSAQNPFADTSEPSQIASLIFSAIYDFAAFECTDTSDKRFQNTSPTTIGKSSVFIIHPDHPTFNLRKDHQNHFHIQIGPTQTETNPP